MGHFDSENTGGLYIRVCYVFYDNIDLQRKKFGISNSVVKGIKIQRLQVYIDQSTESTGGDGCIEAFQ